VIDPLGIALDGAGTHRIVGLPLAVLAGAATSIGPCVAPRYLALAALIGTRRPFVPVAAFMLGLVIATVTLGAGASIAAVLVTHVATIDAVMAVLLIGLGIATIVREPRCTHATALRPVRASGAFALGAASALVVSPCCTPLIVGFAGLGAFDRDPLVACAYVAAFAFGHALPLAFAGIASTPFAAAGRVLAATAAPAVVSGSLTIALGAYYGLLA
jgi:cytochrome c biogenesis protein CcdA